MEGTMGDTVHYQLPLHDVLDPMDNIDMNELVGKRVGIEFMHYLNSVLSGRRMKKAYGEGMTYDEFANAPEASPSIIRPELSRIHEGIALRDYVWEMEHHMKPHTVYLSITNNKKVGVTRDTQVPSRWIDQGAVKAVVLANTPYRQLAGLIEVALKQHISDKTNWQRMLKGEIEDSDLAEEKSNLITFLPDNLKEYVAKDDLITELKYPVLSYPEKVTSIKLDKIPEFTKTLTGIRGQYLMFDDGHVFNVRSHAGCRVRIHLPDM